MYILLLVSWLIIEFTRDKAFYISMTVITGMLLFFGWLMNWHVKNVEEEGE